MSATPTLAPAPAPRRLEPATSAAAKAADDALVLLRRGKTRMAMTVLEGLPLLFRDELTDKIGAASWAGYCRGHEAGRAALAAEIAGVRQRSKKSTRLDWLRGKVADPKLRQRALEVLRLDDRLLDRVATGTAQLSGTQWRRLRAELGR